MAIQNNSGKSETNSSSLVVKPEPSLGRGGADPLVPALSAAPAGCPGGSGCRCHFTTAAPTAPAAGRPQGRPGRPPLPLPPPTSTLRRPHPPTPSPLARPGTAPLRPSLPGRRRPLTTPAPTKLQLTPHPVRWWWRRGRGEPVQRETVEARRSVVFRRSRPTAAAAAAEVRRHPLPQVRAVRTVQVLRRGARPLRLPGKVWRRLSHAPTATTATDEVETE